ncbi:hypothetical protein, partial [Aeromonas veronii]
VANNTIAPSKKRLCLSQVASTLIVFQRKTAALRSSWFVAAVDAFVAGPRKVMLTLSQLVLDYNRR